MRIGLDFPFLAIRRQGLVRGIPRFTQEQLQAVLSLDPDNTYLLLCDAGVDVEAIRSEIRLAPNAHVVWAPDDVSTPARPVRDTRTLLARCSAYQRWLEGLHLDLYHATCPAMLTGVLMPGFDVCPYVATAYDLIPLLYPAHYLPDPVDRETYEQRLLFLEQATRIAAISHSTAEDIIERLGVPAERIDITPPAPSPCFHPLPAEAARSILRSLNHPTRLRSRRRVEIPANYVLCVTDLHYSKNLTTLLPAYAELPAATRARFPLVVAGHLASGEVDALQRLANQLDIGGDLIITGRVSDQELAALYNGSTIAVHPSHHEGFGLPVAEAMRCGTPVITTTRSALPETAGDAAVLVDSDDTAAFTRAIDLLLHDSEQRDELRRRGIEQAARYTPAELGRTTLRCYELAVSNSGRVTSDAIRVALWSPIPPQDTAVSYYTDDLVSTLTAERDLELDIFVDDGVLPPPHLLRAARLHHHSDFDRTARHRPFDVIVYQVAASPLHAYMEPAMLRHPGAVVLHDLRWSRALLGCRRSRAESTDLFRAEVNASEGEQAVREWDRLLALPSRGTLDAERRFLDDHPMLARIVDTATCCVAVTPALERELVRRYPQARLSQVIPVGVRDPQQHAYGVDRASARAYLDLDRDAFMVLVPANDVSEEAIQSALTAFAGLRRAEVDAVAAVTGAVTGGANEDGVRAQADSLGVGDAVRVTGNLSRVAFDAYLAACDAVVMLDGDAATTISDPAIRAFAAGRCAVLCDSEAARSLPDSVCIRVSSASHASADVTEALTELARDRERRERIEHAARTHYEQTARLEPMVEGYLELIRQQAGRRPALHGPAIQRPTVIARTGRPAPRPGHLAYSKACELEDFAHPDLRPVIRDVCAHKRQAFGDDFPTGYEYRKDWEVAMAVRTLADHGVLREDARVLGVAAGTEDTVFYLTRHVGEVVAVDLYREPGQWEETAPPMMLVNPGRLAPFAFRADRLKVQHMDARILDYPDESFDGIFSSGSIEHFGDLETIAAAAYEMGRVLKPEGVLTLSTELLLSRNGSDAGWQLPGTFLLSPSEVLRYIVAASGLEPVDELDVSVSHWTLGTSRNITQAVVDRHTRQTSQPVGTGGPGWTFWEMPHIVMEWGDKRFTSVHLALRRAPSHPVVDNSWAQPTPALRADVAQSENGYAPAVPLVGEIRELVRKGDAAGMRIDALCREASAATAAINADLQEAAMPHAGVYGGATPGAPRPAAALDPSTVTATLRTVKCPIASTVSPPYTVVVQQDAEDIISAAYLAGNGAGLNANLISLLLALVPPGGVLLDIGANIGSISLPLAVSGRQVLSVEADPVNAWLLGMSARASGVSDRMRVVATAVGDHDGEATFMPHGCHGQLVDGEVVGAMRVPLTTIDSLIESEQMERVDLVKIDVEGADVDVLRGMPRLAARAKAPHVLVECCPFTLAAYRHTVAELVAQLEEYGYAVYNVDDNRLMRRRPDEVQVTTVMDVVAVKGGAHGLPGWRVEPPMSRRELIERLIAESRIWNPDCRATAARMARELNPDVLAVPDVAAVLDQLSNDSEPIVRAAAAWWRQAQAVSGVRR